MPAAKKGCKGAYSGLLKPVSTELSGLFFATCNHLARWQAPDGYISRISLKNNEIESFEVAKQGAIFIATFLHTRSFNILRRLGIGAKRKTSENQ